MIANDFQVFFSLGEAVAFIGLVIALSQLANVKNRLIWQLERRYRTSVLILASIGFVLPLGAFVAYSYVPNADWLANLLQGFGYIFILLSFIDLLRMYIWGKRRLIVSHSKIPRYTTSRMTRFFFAISRKIIEKHYEAVADLLIDNLEALLILASKFNPGFANKKPSNSEVSEYAAELLEIIFTDSSFMKYIVETRLDFLSVFKQLEKRINMDSQVSGVYYREISDALIKNKESYLYRQKDTYRGTSRSINVYEMFYGDSYVLEKGVLFSSLRLYQINKDHVDLPVNIYAEALVRVGEVVVGKFKKNARYLSTSIRNISALVYEAQRLIEKIVYDTELRKKIEKMNTPEYEAYNALTSFLTSIIEPQRGYKNPKAFEESETELKSVAEDSYRETTLTSIAARASYEALKALSVFNSDKFFVYHAALDILQDYDTMTPIRTKYRELLYELLFEKIKDNELGYYPMVFRPVVSVLAVIQPEDDGKRTYDQPTLEAWKQVKKILNTTVKNAVKNNQPLRSDAKNKLLADEMLPKNVVYKKTKAGVTFYTVATNDEKTPIKLT